MYARSHIVLLLVWPSKLKNEFCETLLQINASHQHYRGTRDILGLQSRAYATFAFLAAWAALHSMISCSGSSSSSPWLAPSVAPSVACFRFLASFLARSFSM